MNADRSEYSEEVYYAAIEFFQEQNMEENMIHELQKKVIDSTFFCDESNCMQASLELRYLTYYTDDLNLTVAAKNRSTLCNFRCALFYGDGAVKAYKRRCYYIAIWSGQKSFNYSDKLGEYHDGLGCGSSLIVGKSYYHIGNYSAAWLNHALKCFKKAHRPKYMYTSPTLSEERMVITF